MSTQFLFMKATIRNFINDRLNNKESDLKTIFAALEDESSCSIWEKISLLTMQDPVDAWTFPMTLVAYFPHYVPQYFKLLECWYKQGKINKKNILVLITQQNTSRQNFIDLIAQAIFAKKLFIATRHFFKQLGLMNSMVRLSITNNNQPYFSNRLARLFSSLFKILTKAFHTSQNAQEIASLRRGFTIKM